MAAPPWAISRRRAPPRAKSHGLSIVFLQSNKEGELVEFLQEARSHAAGVILNAAGYTHTSVAILDALQMLKPAGDRSASFQSGAARGIPPSLLCRQGRHRHIAGLGVNSYLLAIDAVAAILPGPRKRRNERQE